MSLIRKNMSLIGNRKRPRGLSDLFELNKMLNTGLKEGKAPATTGTTNTHANGNNSDVAMMTPPTSHISKEAGGFGYGGEDDAYYEQSYTNRSIFHPKYQDGLPGFDDIEEDDIEDAMEESNDDDDLIIVGERDLKLRNNSDSILFLDKEACAAYNMFNVNPPRKQRTNSLPQLPQVRCFYHKIPSDYVLRMPKLGDVATNVIPFRLDLPPCDDDDGHYIFAENDEFANRFMIIKLLGQGTFGKVVECYDRVNRTHVAIKIIKNIEKYRDAAKIELRVLLTLKKFDNENRNHCIHLRECFDYRGHICIVTDLLKISLYDFLSKNKFIAYPGSHIQAVAKQLIRSVTFLHDLNLIHTDLKPENILLHDDSFTRKPLKSSTLIALYTALSSNSDIDDVHKKVPKYLRILNDPLIQVIDFGSAIFDDEYHLLIVSTRHYRAPEIVLGIGWLFPCDMWSIGCILVELLIGEPLFRTHDNLEHLAMIEKVCGYSIDKTIVRRLKQLGNDCGLKYFTDDVSASSDEDSLQEKDMYALKDSDSEEYDDDVIIDDVSTARNALTLRFPTKSTPDKFIESVNELSRIDLFVSSRIGLEINLDYLLSANYERNKHLINFGNFTFWWFFIDLLRKLFVIDPVRRMTAVEAMEHPWFNLGIEDEGTM